MLQSIDTMPPDYLEKKDIKEETEKLIERLEYLQNLFYANQKYGLLIVFQWMDASWKDGLVRHLASALNPMGCRAISFKQPSKEEASHDYLWRIHKEIPARWMITIFNRSHYEDILAPSVQDLGFDESTIDARYDQINEFEKYLKANNIIVLKFYLHISKEEQKLRLQERLENKEKFWKYSKYDWESRKSWEDYMEVYEKIFDRCNVTPWNIIPTDENWYKVYLVAKKLVEAFESLNLRWPELKKE